MRISFLMIVIGVSSVCMTDFVSAQGRGFDRGGGAGNWLGLLRNQAIQDEIEMVPDQLKEIEELQMQMQDDMQKRMADLRNLEPAIRREKFASLRVDMKEQQEEFKTRIEEVLLPDQVKRLNELHIQSNARRHGNGAMGVLKDEAVLEELGVDEDQKKNLKEKADEIRERLEEQIKKLRMKAEKELLSVLSSPQQKKYREMVGETFDFENNLGRRALQSRADEK